MGREDNLPDLGAGGYRTQGLEPWDAVAHFGKSSAHSQVAGRSLQQRRRYGVSHVSGYGVSGGPERCRYAAGIDPRGGD